MLGRKIARHSVAIIGTALLGGLLSATMVRLAPGFDTDEAQIDSHLNSESLRALREARSQQNNILVFYLQSLKRASQGDLGSSLTLHQPVSKLLRERAPLTSPPDRRRVARELGGGDDVSAQRGRSAPEFL